MVKVILSIACTLDGYIARKNGSVDFLDPFNESGGTGDWFGEFLKSISVIVMGNKTFQEYHTFPGFFEYYKGKELYVFSRNNKLHHEKVIFIDEDPKDFIKNLNIKGDIWLLGGANIIKSFQDSNLIDEYIISIIPVTIGSGIPLFKKSDHDMQLNFVKTESFNSGIVNLHYTKK